MNGHGRNSFWETGTAPAGVGVVVETVEKTLRALGYQLAATSHTPADFITEHYGNPAAGLHAIQLEINRALYMDERRYQRSSTFARLAGDMETLASRTRLRSQIPC